MNERNTDQKQKPNQISSAALGGLPSEGPPGFNIITWKPNKRGNVECIEYQEQGGEYKEATRHVLLENVLISTWNA